ncbi:MAG: glycosyl hydrolase family 25 [Bacteroidales bacterium]|nr:glycosyl hydrolase family 25 [Bacteroidales bacterium]
MRRFALVIVVLLVLFPLAASAQKGIDVSRFQDSINWKRVANNSKVEFVYVKATEGASISDPMYKYNVKKAREAGLLVGSYHVYSSRTTAYQQFANFKKTVGKTKQDLVPVLDIEANHCNKLYMARVDKLLELMEKEYGAKPMIYTSEKLYKTHFDIKKYKKYHYFIANYKREPSMAYTLWQYTQRGKLKGIAGFVDFSKFHKKYDVETIKIKKKTAAAQASQDTTATNKTVKDEKTPQPAANANKPTGKSTQTSKSSTK